MINDLQIYQGGTKGNGAWVEMGMTTWRSDVSRQRSGLIYQGSECSKEFIDARRRGHYVDPKRSESCVMSCFRHGVKEDTGAGDTLSSRQVSSHETYVLFSTPPLSLPMRWFSYADVHNLVTWCHIKRSVGALFQ